MDVFLPALIAFLSIAVPGVLLALALLKGTKLHLFEIIGIGLIFGLIAPAALTWIEGYFMDAIHFFAFSATLFELNALILTVIGAVVCYREGVFGHLAPYITGKKREAQQEQEHRDARQSHKVPVWVWALLVVLILVTLYTRMENIGVSQTFFQFDSYYDMLDTQRLVVLGYQPLLSNSAWPVVAAGTVTRVQPIIPYLEAYWYELTAGFNGMASSFNTTLMSQLSSLYPPITAALLVFVIFVLLFREYDEYVGLVGAAFAASVPILFTTFIGGQQLLQPWGIFTLFFFFMAYMLAIKDMKSKRLAVLAGVAFASTFLGAHYYTVDAGVLSIYIVVQGIISSLRGGASKDFYKMNVIMFIVIAIFLGIYEPYGAVYGSGLPSIAGIPITIALPVLSLLLVAIIDLLPKFLHSRHILFKEVNMRTRAAWMLLLLVIVIIAVFVTPLGDPIRSLAALSAKFTTPSTPLFMTVQEYAPTGLFYDYGASGMGEIAASFFGFPFMVYLVMGVAIILLIISILYRRSDTGVFYLLIALPLAVAAFSEVAYIPHFSAAYVMLFGIIIGEIGVLASNNFKLKFEHHDTFAHLKNSYETHKDLMYGVFSVALFFVSPFLALAFLVIAIFAGKPKSRNAMWALFGIFVVIEIASFATGQIITGEASSITQAFSAAATYSSASNANAACTALSNQSNNIGVNLFCNQIPQYWLNAMAFINETVGPGGPRILSWWDYGDWINWFGQSRAVLRGDNSVPKEDFATAAHYVLGSNDSYGPQTLVNFMNANQTKYVLFDQDLIGKWGALDFLACININATSRAFAISQGQQQSPQQPFALGTSACELAHDPEFLLVPLPTLAPSLQQPALNEYCSISSNSSQYALSYVVVGSSLSNQTFCTSLSPNKNGAARLYHSNGTALNAYVSLGQQPLGSVRLSQNGPIYLQYLIVYTPNAPNGTITNAPTGFYDSNYYRGFFLGYLPNMTAVYPSGSANVINYVNGSYAVRIYALNDFTGNVPQPVQKPAYVVNNYTTT